MNRITKFVRRAVWTVIAIVAVFSALLTALIFAIAN